jgi:hypothetical protein
MLLRRISAVSSCDWSKPRLLSDGSIHFKSRAWADGRFSGLTLKVAVTSSGKSSMFDADARWYSMIRHDAQAVGKQTTRLTVCRFLSGNFNAQRLQNGNATFPVNDTN